MQLKRVLVIMIAAIILLSGCRRESVREKTTAHMVEYIEYISSETDRAIADLQKSLKLDFQQTEILYLLKSDLLAKIPEIREMVFAFQLDLAELLDKEEVTEAEVEQLFANLDIYEKVLKETVVRRFVELHATMNREQKERLVAYLDGKRVLPFKVKPFPFLNYGSEIRELVRDLALTREQKKEMRLFGRKMRKLAIENRGEIKELAKEKKAALRALILSDEVSEEDFNRLVAESMLGIKEFKALTIEQFISFHKGLSREQRDLLIRFISSFNPL